MILPIAALVGMGCGGDTLDAVGLPSRGNSRQPGGTLDDDSGWLARTFSGHGYDGELRGGKFDIPTANLEARFDLGPGTA